MVESDKLPIIYYLSRYMMNPDGPWSQVNDLKLSPGDCLTERGIQPYPAGNRKPMQFI